MIWFHRLNARTIERSPHYHTPSYSTTGLLYVYTYNFFNTDIVQILFFLARFWFRLDVIYISLLVFYFLFLFCRQYVCVYTVCACYKFYVFIVHRKNEVSVILSMYVSFPYTRIYVHLHRNTKLTEI